MKYRIKSNTENFFGITVHNLQETYYCVQCKIKFIPIWFKVTRYFNTKIQAEEYIKLILDVKDSK